MIKSITIIAKQACQVPCPTPSGLAVKVNLTDAIIRLEPEQLIDMLSTFDKETLEQVNKAVYELIMNRED